MAGAVQVYYQPEAGSGLNPVLNDEEYPGTGFTEAEIFIIFSQVP